MNIFISTDKNNTDGHNNEDDDGGDDDHLSLLRLPSQNITDWGAHTAGIHLLTILEARSPRSRCQQDWLLWKPLSLA